METIKQMLQAVYQSNDNEAFYTKLKAVKEQNKDVSWYPFDTLGGKLHLVTAMGKYFDDKEIGFIDKNPKVLDIGAADGDFSFLFESAGCEVTAIDNARSNYNRCAGIKKMHELLGSKITYIEKDIDHGFPDINNQHDIALFLDILYHLRNPLLALISVAQISKFMMLSTRIFDQTQSGKSAQDIPCAYLLAPFEAAKDDPTNFWIFTESGLQRLLERSGWRILNKVYFGYEGTDSTPNEPNKDKRVAVLCERIKGYEQLKYGHCV